MAPQYLDGGRHLAVQLTAVFRYGREDDEILGLRFAKEFCLASLLVDQSPTPEPLTGQLVPTLSSFVFFFFFGYCQTMKPNSLRLQPNSSASHFCQSYVDDNSFTPMPLAIAVANRKRS